MAEPPSAFLQLRVPRANLVRWLDAPVRSAADWHDWREIGGSYHLGGGPRDLATIPDEALARTIEEADAGLATCATNRAALRAIMGFAEARFFRRCTYDEATQDFVAGTLTYDENLVRYIQFLALGRGAADALMPDGHGIALIHNYVWSPEIAGKAIVLGPGATSTFAGAEAYSAAVPLFQPIAEEMLAIGAEVDEELDKAPMPIDVLDRLK